MASFKEHIEQAKKNLNFLESVNYSYPIGESDDWQVTILFYGAVHLINAHIAQTCNLHYNSHKKVEQAISPFNPLSPASLPEDVYLAYKLLRNLSRRSRYLCKDSDSPLEEAKAYLTFDKHVAKAIKHMDVIIDYMVAKYKIKFTPINIISMELSMRQADLHNFTCFPAKTTAMA